MGVNKRRLTAFAAAAAMAVLILDAKIAFAAAQAGAELCIRTVIPALFPFLVLSVLLTGNLSDVKFRFLRPLGRLCRIPEGTETILLTGFLGGYPVGAQCVTQANLAGQLSRETARRMLGFCSNAGPAFLFGMLTPLFSDATVLWWLWGIHISSAILTGILLPGEMASQPCKPAAGSVSVAAALQRSLKIMASICGWVVIFRILIEFCDRWFMWMFPEVIRVGLIGILELTNGCNSLSEIPVESTRFLLCAIFLGLGGICVGLQTVSVTGKLGTGLYFPGKLTQGTISFFLAGLLQRVIYPLEQQTVLHPVILIFALCPIILWIGLKKRKKSSSNLQFQSV